MAYILTPAVEPEPEEKVTPEEAWGAHLRSTWKNLMGYGPHVPGNPWPRVTAAFLASIREALLTDEAVAVAVSVRDDRRSMREGIAAAFDHVFGSPPETKRLDLAGGGTAAEWKELHRVDTLQKELDTANQALAKAARERDEWSREALLYRKVVTRVANETGVGSSHLIDVPGKLASRYAQLKHELVTTQKALREAQGIVRMATANRGDVWVWQGDGLDDPESLSASARVVMSAETLWEFLAAERRATAAEDRLRSLEQHPAEECPVPEPFFAAWAKGETWETDEIDEGRNMAEMAKAVAWLKSTRG